MNAEVDWNKVIAQVFIDLAKSTVKTASGTLSSAIASLLHAFQKDLNPYLLSTLKRCSSVRTLLHRDQPVFLTSIYVKTYLKIGKRKIDDDYFIESLPKIENALIIGTAGSGKSFFLKYLFLALFELRRGKIPLFIELRQMNSMQTRDLILFMYHSVITPGGVITQDQFQQALKEGLFTIILDGFDEIEFDWRPDLEKQIFKLQESHPQNQFLISSRPDERFSAWHNFSIFHIQPMAKKEVLSLVRKIDYEQDVKKRFIKAIRSGMYEKHASFLSTPLLAIMMLLTFDQFASIPDKIHVFYDHAFDALFAKHDASKQGGYRRRSRTGLAIDDFKRCLSAFCAATYAKGKAVFSETETRGFLTQAFQFEKQNVKIDDFIHGLIESVCILQRDGLFLTFSHRSFQEYFTAYFVCRSPAVDLSRLLDQIMWKYTDTVLRMSFDMNRNLLEREWILPKLNYLNELISQVPKEDIFGYLTLYFTRPAIFWAGNDINIAVGQFRDRGIFRIWLYHFYTNKFRHVRARSTKDMFNEMLERHRPITKSDKVDDEDEETPLPDSFRLNEQDNEALKNSWLSEYVESERKMMQSLKDDVAESLNQQRSILEDMFDPRIGVDSDGGQE